MIGHSVESGDWRVALGLGAGVALGLGLARATVQSMLQPASDPMRLTGSLVAASLIWLPVPLLVQAVWRVSAGLRHRWVGLAAIAATIAVIEPLWFLATLSRLAGWHPRGGYAINAALRLDTNLLIVVGVAGWLWLREVQRRRWSMAERVAALRTRAGDAELDVLTMQLQPHFLFNTLNLVSQLAYESTTRAHRAIANLRRLLDESVGPATPVVTLGEELRLLEAYLAIQRDRFGSRLDARIAVDADTLDARVPRMLLQPIVENAIRHGIAPRKTGGSVRLRVRRLFTHRLSIEVSDTGVGIAAGEIREGVGLSNVRHRLQQLYPGATSLEVTNREGGAVASIELPFSTRAGRAGVSDGDPIEPSPADQDVVELETRLGARLRALAMFAGWAVVAAIWTELEAIVPRALHQAVPWGQLFAKNFLNAGVWMALTPLTLRLADALVARGRASRVASHVVGALAFTAVHLTATGVLMNVVLRADAESVRAVRFGWAVWDLIAYATLVAIGETLATRARLREQAIEAAHARGRLALARVALMRLHLQPGLLLASIDAIDRALGDPERCETAITRFGDVLRHLLANAGREETSLGDEIALLEAYASIVGRAVSNEIMDPGDLAALVPSVLLCSLANGLGAGALSIRVSRDASRLTLEMTADRGDSVDDALATGTDRRLAALYGAEYRFRFVRRDGSVSAICEIPYRSCAMVTSLDSAGERAIA